LLGAVIFAAAYIFSYIRLRFILKKGTAVPDDLRREINLLAGRYNLYAPKRIVALKGLPSAFVCGFFKPVLVLPEDRAVDEKIILHELLHLKHGDTVQSAVICFLRCINWFNPVMHYVFGRMSNDIEALCDLRTLEKLEGESRRDYGILLLSMVNERYQKVPCTSSASNGGKNIARRIDSIVKFKKYPKGMGVVSVCIVLLLLMPCLYGYAVEMKNYEPYSEKDFNFAVASARSAKCTTMAGALDTFSKGLAQKNGIMLLCAVPEDMHEEIISEMRKDGEFNYYYSTGIEFENLTFEDMGTCSSVYNITKTGDRTYKADIHFDIETNVNTEKLKKIYGEVPENNAVLVMPVIIENHDGWTVREAGGRFLLDINYDNNDSYYIDSCEAEGKTGKVRCSFRYKYFIKSENKNQDNFFGGWIFNTTPDLSAEFESEYYDRNTVYEANEEYRQSFVGKYITIITKTCYDEDDLNADKFEDVKETATNMGGIGGGSNTAGYSWSGRTVYNGWDGIEKDGSGGGYSGSGIKPAENKQPFAYKVWIFADSELIDEFTIYTEEDKQYDK
ncbi:MAG: M56 family metallopeptidase, partial [Clostridia bacterium]|nr:M56 family metallopeptidase [Clostridia bacterium]